MERQKTFAQLKQSCVELLQAISVLPQRPDGKRAVVRALEKLLRTLQQVAAIPGALDAKLAEFAFVPISRVLSISGTVPVRALELCLDCIAILLRTGWKDDLSSQLAGQLLILFTFLANPSSAESGIPATSEELQVAAFECTTALFASIASSKEGRASLTSTSNVPNLGKAVLVIVDSIAENTSGNVRLKAVLALEILISAIDDRDALASFLPRMVSSLTKTLAPSSGGRSGYRLLEGALNTLSLLVRRVLSDQETSDLPPQSEEGKIIRSSSWLEATASQIKVALSGVLRLRSHDKREVRQALLHLCRMIVQDCRQSLSGCTTMMIETMVFLAGHKEDHDSAENDVRLLVQTDTQLAGLLRESLHGWVLSLPRLMQSKDDGTRRQVIQQVSVTLRLLDGVDVDLSLVNDLLAGNLRDGVVHVLNDSKGLTEIVTSLESASVNSTLSVDVASSSRFPPIALRLRGQDEMMKEFKNLVRELAGSSSATTVARDVIAALSSGTDEAQLASFWLGVNLVGDIMEQHGGADDLLDFGTPDVEIELLDELYSFALTNIGEANHDIDSHWRTQALSLEVIAMQARKHRADFRGELIEALYPVLHLLGIPHTALRNHAITCLNIVADSCGYLDASDLVISNVDYIVNAVGLKLNYHDISPQAPQVLLMMMRLCGPSLLPYLDDLVGSMFSALERYHGYPKLVELLFSVLKTMAEEGVKAPQLMITASEEADSQERRWKGTSIAEVASSLEKMKRELSKSDEEHLKLADEAFPTKPWKEESDETNEDSPPDGEQAERAQEDDPPPPAPKTFGILLKISELTQHYLTSPSTGLRTSLLDLLHTTIPALAKHENSFLPLINTLWPVLLPRLDDSEAYIVSNTMDVIALMCEYAGNFMRSRIDGIWKELKRVHRQTLKQPRDLQGKQQFQGASDHISLTNEDDSRRSLTSALEPARTTLYVKTPTRMIWDSLMGLLVSITKHVDIRDETFDDIVDMLDPVLDRPYVREALRDRNPDVLWLREFKMNKLQKGNTKAKVVNRSTSKPTASPIGKTHWRFAPLEL
ncbi:HEAT repeat protein-like protein [Polyplosphaeria fusca]|uniref:HEAT repeat protein-like protein n=1 Tax=Polyplosphaeria fusca TaxID=682080 RepID=A0A9P4R3W2_9PLEO|nr:HEAT repeat protein-like protein [Polyplosphaeria fusca]